MKDPMLQPAEKKFYEQDVCFYGHAVAALSDDKIIVTGGFNEI